MFLAIEFVALVFTALAVELSHVDTLWVGSLRGIQADAVIGVGEDRIADFVVGWQLELIEMVVGSIAVDLLLVGLREIAGEVGEVVLDGREVDVGD